MKQNSFRDNYTEHYREATLLHVHATVIIRLTRKTTNNIETNEQLYKLKRSNNKQLRYKRSWNSKIINKFNNKNLQLIFFALPVFICVQ